MRALRLPLLLAVGLCLAAFDDPAGRYAIDFPEGWATTSTSPEGFTFAKEPNSSTNCGAKAAPVAAFDGMTQDQINAELFTNPLFVTDWAGVFAANSALLTLESGEVIEVNGLKMQIATIVFGAGFENIPYETKGRVVVTATPGIVYIGTCLAETANFDGFSEIFETTVRSLRPL